MSLPEPLNGIVREVQRRMMAEPTGDWQHITNPDDAMEVLLVVIDAVIPRGPTLWNLYATYPALRMLPSPDSVGKTIEDCVRSVISDAVERTLSEWMDAMRPPGPACQITGGDHEWEAVTRIALTDEAAEKIAAAGYWTCHPDAGPNVQARVRCGACGREWEA